MDKFFAFGHFWERKMRSYISRLDLDGDGQLTRADYEMLLDRYLKLGKIDEFRAKQVTRKILSVWDIFFDNVSTNGVIDADAWIAVIKRHSVFVYFRVVVEFMNIFFDLIDTNGDGVIQKDEYAFFLKAFRVEDEADITASFNMLDMDGDGKIDHTEFMNAAVEFWMTDDESLPSKLLFGPLV